MKNLQFKTNIKCSGCIAAVTPYLSAEPEIKEWNVDINHPDKILRVSTELDEEKVKDLITKAGYKADTIVETK